jgi:predicted nucleic acid-binding protein
VDATTTVEVIQEFAHVRARRRTRADAVALARSYRAAFPLLSANGDDLLVGLSLFERYQELGAFAAMLLAVALRRRAEALVSADHAFRTVEHLLRWIDPATPAIERLLTP